jgi:hypothetical protein
MKKWVLLLMVNWLKFNNVYAGSIAGSIENDAYAQNKCPGICSGNNMTWNRTWITTILGKISVCGWDTKMVQPAPQAKLPLQLSLMATSTEANLKFRQ